MDTTFDFRLMHLDGPLSQHVQAVWSASVSSCSQPVNKPLFSDGASGAFIILKGEVTYEQGIYQQGIHWVSVQKQAQFITMSPELLMLGFRFQPGISKEHFSVFRQSEATKNSEKQEVTANQQGIKGLISRLSEAAQTDQLTVLCQWLQQHLKSDVIENGLTHFIRHIDHKAELKGIEQQLPLSLRQIERQFKSQIGFTPKYYQRLMRIRAAIQLIKQNPSANLVDLAIEAGFSDQAHMNREFRQLARMTPKEYQATKKV
ncbi:hypothetical protein NBRC116188_17240 [Oceaniserpentilla sp. 4NH20-0058]|uniref:helix-turn-helix domain-containing protein n=1 Tax=Oceaniserpentilla sp. 4NH20-0058 TaxID=3127660 RepID=UPI003103DABB